MCCRVYGEVWPAHPCLKVGLEHLDAALGSDAPPVADKRRLIDQLRTLVIRSIYEQLSSVLEAAGPALVRVLAERAGTDEGARHDLLVLLTVAHVASELRRDPGPRDALLSGLDAAGRDRKQYAREELEKAGEAEVGLMLPPGRMVEYRVAVPFREFCTLSGPNGRFILAFGAFR
jgi:hypothetical protein